MSNMQQVAIIKQETALGIDYLLGDPSAVQKGGVFDQIEYGSNGNIKFSRYPRKSGEFSDCQHLFVYSEAHRTQMDLTLAVQREIDRMRLNARQFSLDVIRARLSNAGYNVSKMVPLEQIENKDERRYRMEAERYPIFPVSYGTPQDGTSARGYEGSGVRFDSADGTRVRFDPAYTDRMARLLENILLQRRNKR